MSEDKPDVFERADMLIKALAMGPGFRPVDYAGAYGSLSGKIKYLAIASRLPAEDLQKLIQRVALEEQELSDQLSAQHAANMEALKP
jgi:hypothetical protein